MYSLCIKEDVQIADPNIYDFEITVEYSSTIVIQQLSMIVQIKHFQLLMMAMNKEQPLIKPLFPHMVIFIITVNILLKMDIQKIIMKTDI